jgi:hypothetical protein
MVHCEEHVTDGTRFSTWRERRGECVQDGDLVIVREDRDCCCGLWDGKYEEMRASGYAASSVGRRKSTGVARNPDLKNDAFEPNTPNGWSARMKWDKEKCTWRNGKVVDAFARVISDTHAMMEGQDSGKSEDLHISVDCL